MPAATKILFLLPDPAEASSESMPKDGASEVCDADAGGVVWPESCTAFSGSEATAAEVAADTPPSLAGASFARAGAAAEPVVT